MSRKTMLRRTITLGAVAALGAVSLASAQGGVLAPYAANGPMGTINHAEGPDCTIFRPDTLGAGGKKNPVIIWSNGRGQTPAKYAAMLTELASYGFVVGASNSGNAGTGKEALACLDYLTAENSQAGSPYQGKLDLDHVGAAGHSQGGGGTIMAGRDPRVKATAPIMPYTGAGLGFEAGSQGQQHGPMLLLSGGADTIAPPDKHQQPVYDGANVPVVWATLDGASHMVPATADSGAIRPIVVAWFRYQLQGDEQAGTLFQGDYCGLCSDSSWVIKQKE